MSQGSIVPTPPVTDEQSTTMLRQLGLLGLLKRGLVPYYQMLLQESDERLRVAAIIALLELKAIWSSQADLVLAHANHGAVKRRAFPFFMSVFEYGLAEKVALTPSEDIDELLKERQLAELRLDYGRMTELDIALFMAHGSPDHLWSAEGHADLAGGWRVAVPIYSMSLLARPVDPNAPFQLLTALLNANQLELVETVCAAFEQAQVYRVESAVFRAAVLVGRREGKEALKVLDRTPPSAANARLNSFNLRTRADALAALKSYRDAYGAYQRMNAVDRPKDVDPKSFSQNVRTRANYRVEPVATDERDESSAMMLGFPRSGTTLLENMLAAHPKVETFEEVPGLTRMARWLERFSKDGAVPAPLAAEARDKYFDEFARRSSKEGAKLRVDKLPLLSADAPFLEKIFPGMRYVFSIRHPYDVVLSCFKQSFTPNSAMENFRTIADASTLYNFTMSQWFSVHSLNDDPDVCYVRYEELVQSFRPTAERVLDFLGVGWDDSVLDFAEAAGKRAAMTPSYQKVRSGLSIGVQTSWHNYDFLWNTKETAVLKKWVKHFGYED